jgi:uncharacterized protein with HXXEE motif
VRLLSHLSFHQAVWLYSAAFCLHVLEEWPNFTRWARRYASPMFTQKEYNTIHLAGIAVAVTSAWMLWMFPNRVTTFLFFSVVFTPSTLCNTVFHAGATVLKKAYCPGLVTAVLLYLPLFFFLSQRAHQEGLFPAGAAAASLLLAGVFHTWEVGHNVFKAW